MRKTVVSVAVVAVTAIALGYVGRAETPAAQGRGAAAPAAPPAAARGRGTPPQAVFPLESNFLDWRLQPSEQKYAAIDGMRMLGYIKDLAAISRRCSGAASSAARPTATPRSG